jgi:hypothetical protein
LRRIRSQENEQGEKDAREEWMVQGWMFSGDIGLVDVLLGDMGAGRCTAAAYTTAADAADDGVLQNPLCEA